MKIVPYSTQLKLTGERVVALGFFDGVHLGHRDMIERARRAARERGCELAVFTFSSESQELKGGRGRIYDTDARLSLLSELGVDLAVVARFSDVCHLSPEQFTSELLIDRLGTVLAVCGFNFRYGNGASGDADLLVREMREHGDDALVVPAFCAVDGDAISTTKIKELLAGGNVREANVLLGKPYAITSRVEEGLHLGRTFGVPTVNQSFDKNLLRPKSGVYRSAAVVRGVAYHALTNVGSCPTFGARPIHAETFLIDESIDLYGEIVTVYLLDYLRGERTFEDAKSLKMQILVDKTRVKEENGEIQWLANGQS